MLYNFLYPLAEHWSWLNIFQYISFRSIYALVTSLVLCWLFGPACIRWLQKHQGKGQPIRDDGPESHFSKKGTPTMGGILILLSLTISTLLWADLSNIFIWLALFVTLSYAGIGCYDDYLKVIRHDPKGLAGRWKLLLQVIFGTAAAIVLFYTTEPIVDVPIFNVQWHMGFWYVPFVVFVLVATSNAVNLTDGLDGLAVTPTLMVAGTFGVIAYLSGHIHFAEYLLIPPVVGAGELTVFCAAMAGACLGFLWFNTYPAQVFMGDIGSLALGGALALVACVIHQQFLLVIAGGLFVVEAISVIVQVASFKMTGKRVFRMAPIHHHFELKGWAEPKVIVRFWIIAFLLALLALSTLKLR
ncbi:MAG: phospho-N-acetylmuramoyl-pentapeptide-transferase [Mariprofundaceae bacterium]|nr:phospho-N-acetylmuramoyl-pentapeptide-transferase [Mariprofundaceae bacterium]